jgi:hypothetical protein
MTLTKEPVNPEVLNVRFAVMARELMARKLSNGGENTDSRGQFQVGRNFGDLPE